MFVGREQVVAGRNMEHSLKKRTHLMSAEFDGMVDGLGIPTGRHSGGKQGFHFRREVESLIVEGIEEGLYAETVAGSEDGLIDTVPKHKRELAP
jgi:hypothetical protein